MKRPLAILLAIFALAAVAEFAYLAISRRPIPAPFKTEAELAEMDDHDLERQIPAEISVHLFRQGIARRALNAPASHVWSTYVFEATLRYGPAGLAKQIADPDGPRVEDAQAAYVAMGAPAAGEALAAFRDGAAAGVVAAPAAEDAPIGVPLAAASRDALHIAYFDQVRAAGPARVRYIREHLAELVHPVGPR